MLPYRCCLTLTALLLLLTTPLQARVTLVYSSLDADHFRIQIPDGWKVNVGREPNPDIRTEQGWIVPRIVTAMPGDDETPLWFGIWVPPDVFTLAGAKQYMDSLGPVLLSDVTVDKRVTTRLNSLAALHVSGTGFKDKEQMDFHAFFIQLTPRSIVIAIYIGPPEATDKYGQALAEMIRSIEPATDRREEGQ